MADKRSLTLQIAHGKDFAILNRILLLLVLLAAALSPQPLALTLLVFLIAGMGFAVRTLWLPNVYHVRLMRIMFADGQIKLLTKSGGTVTGYLDGQQWYTQHVAVLKVATGDKTRSLIILSGQQHADDFRRLKVWLRQGAALLLKSEGRVQS